MRYNPKMRETSISIDSSEIGTLLEPHRATLQLHCYRMTGSLQDAEDLVQETFVRAWRRYDSFEGKSSLSTWLYRIATNVCLDMLRKKGRRRQLRPDGPASDPGAPVGDPTEAALWLEPYPDSELTDISDSPEQLLLKRENISLAFIAMLQFLPPRQRASLVLNDVLDWPAKQVAESLDTSVSAVESALHRARASLAKHRNLRETESSKASFDESNEQALLDRLVNAWEEDDLDGVVALLHQDVSLSMPPFSSWYQGRAAVHAILALHPFGQRKRAGWRLFATRANGRPAFVLYRADQPGEPYQAFGLMALSIMQSPPPVSVSALTIFKNVALAEQFGFPLIVKPPETCKPLQYP
jgi:RNA polymerase sigma-70 factor (ECF subfamily)